MDVPVRGDAQWLGIKRHLRRRQPARVDIHRDLLRRQRQRTSTTARQELIKVTGVRARRIPTSTLSPMPASGSNSTALRPAGGRARRSSRAAPSPGWTLPGRTPLRFPTTSASGEHRPLPPGRAHRHRRHRRHLEPDVAAGRAAKTRRRRGSTSGFDPTNRRFVTSDQLSRVSPRAVRRLSPPCRQQGGFHWPGPS